MQHGAAGGPRPGLDRPSFVPLGQAMLTGSGLVTVGSPSTDNHYQPTGLSRLSIPSQPF